MLDSTSSTEWTLQWPSKRFATPPRIKPVSHTPFYVYDYCACSGLTALRNLQFGEDPGETWQLVSSPPVLNVVVCAMKSSSTSLALSFDEDMEVVLEDGRCVDMDVDLPDEQCMIVEVHEGTLAKPLQYFLNFLFSCRHVEVQLKLPCQPSLIRSVHGYVQFLNPLVPATYLIISLLSGVLWAAS